MRRSQQADTQDHPQSNGDTDTVAALEAKIRVAVKAVETGLAMPKVLVRPPVRGCEYAQAGDQNPPDNSLPATTDPNHPRR
jgi:hypothetical protein